MGAYAKSGASPIRGLYLLDVVPDGEVRWGFPNIVDTVEIADLMSCGATSLSFSTDAARSSDRPKRACPFAECGSIGSRGRAPPSGLSRPAASHPAAASSSPSLRPCRVGRRHDRRLVRR